VHEAAHAVAARRAGHRVALVSLGIGPLLLTRRLGGATVLVRALPLAGHTVWDGSGATRATRVLILLAGPLATLALAACVLTLGAPATAPAERLLLFTNAVGLLPLIPDSD
jgi:membrane-associated protease RseP (regulator of RpoE activity)